MRSNTSRQHGNNHDHDKEKEKSESFFRDLEYDDAEVLEEEWALDDRLHPGHSNQGKKKGKRGVGNNIYL
jgi:hypothetical protein